MPYLTDLAAIAARTGHPVVEATGWRSRGHGPMGPVRSIVCHHTAGPTTGDMPTLPVLINGRPDLAGPLAHYGISRTGRIHVIAAGRAFHAGPVTHTDYANEHAIGIEAENTGTGQPWPTTQLHAIQALSAQLCRHYGIPTDHVKGHKEICAPPGRKIDPAGITMPDLRATVHNLINPTPTPKKDDDMAAQIVMQPGTKASLGCRHIKGPKVLSVFCDSYQIPGGGVRTAQYAKDSTGKFVWKTTFGGSTDADPYRWWLAKGHFQMALDDTCIGVSLAVDTTIGHPVCWTIHPA